MIIVGTFGLVIQMELFMNFYVGDTLTQESAKIANAAYDFPWYIECDKKICGILQMIICQAQQPVELTAGKFRPISIYSYGRILNAAYSYLTFLKTKFKPNGN